MLHLSDSPQRMTKALTGGKPSSAEYVTLHRIADALRPEMAEALRAGVIRFGNSLTIESLIHAFEQGSLSGVMEDIDFDALRIELKVIDDLTVKAIEKTAEHSVKHLPSITRPAFVFNPRNPRIARYIRTVTAEMVTEINDQNKLAIRQSVRDSMNRGLPPRKMAKLIPRTVGLNERQATARDRLRASLTEQGLPPGRVETQVTAYEKRALKYRMDMIARTESINAVNHGQLETWDQAADQELLDKSVAEKGWVLTPDDRACKFCRSLNGTAVPLDQKFQDTFGQFPPVMSPALHPNCRCAMKLWPRGKPKR